MKQGVDLKSEEREPTPRVVLRKATRYTFQEEVFEESQGYPTIFTNQSSFDRLLDISKK